MKNYLPIIFAFLFPCTLFSQEIEWQKTIGGDEVDQLRVLQQTSDGGYVLGGSSASNSAGDKTENSLGLYDYWVLKLDETGNIVWQNTIGGDDLDHLQQVQQTTDGGYILGGSSWSYTSGDKTEDSKGGYDYWVIKLDESGTILWQKTIGGSAEDLLYSIQQTSDGGYVLGGSSWSSISGDKTEESRGYEDYWIMKLDESGTILWQKTIGGSGTDQFQSLWQTTDGGYIVGGYSESYPSGGDKTEYPIGKEDYWVLKLDTAGNIVWQNTIGGIDEDRLYTVQQTSDGGYMLGGSSWSNISGDKTEDGRGRYDYWMVKLDEAGTILWQKTIGGDGHDYLYDFQETADGGYLLGGTSKSDSSGDKTDNSKGEDDYWIVKLNKYGALLWQKTIGGSGTDDFGDLQQTTDGNYLLGGASDSDISGDKTSNSKGLSDYWLIKLKKTFPASDNDNDGFTVYEDCDDNNPNANPSLTEIPYNGIDDDCNVLTLDDDLDQDGFLLASDCDDNNPNINPYALEIYFNGIDDDCDALTPDNDSTCYTCLPDGIEFLSQAQVDAFPANYPNCIKILGDVRFNWPLMDIYNLDSLRQIKSILRNLRFYKPNGIVSFSGLDSLQYIGGTFYMYKMFVSDFKGLGALKTINGDFVCSYSGVPFFNGTTGSLRNFIGLESLDSIGGKFYIVRNETLNSFTGLPSLRSIGEGIYIEENYMLTTIEGLNQVRYIGDETYIAWNDLSSLSGLDSIDHTAITHLTLQSNNKLSFCGVNSICLYLNNGGAAEISSNALGCNTRSEVETECAPFIDNDNDGFFADTDCDDANAEINPAAAEIVYNGLDDDCDEQSLDDDLDQDGFLLADDCDDANAEINPAVAEIAYNGLDDDCDEQSLDDDLDQDGFLLADDCDDANAEVNPAATEIAYNGLDDDCDEQSLDDDLDQDGFLLADDCDDTNAEINPNANDIPNNGVDENCDGMDALTATYEIAGSKIQVYPNPLSDKLYINIEGSLNIRVQLFNMMGETIFIKQQTNTIDFSELPAGIYLLELYNEKSGEGIIEKIVKPQ